MNLALSAILILLLLLPAFSFRIGIAIPTPHRKKKSKDPDDDLQDQLTSRNVSKALSKLNFTETIFLFSLVPVILHLLSLIIIKLSGFSIRFDLLLNIFSGKNDILDAKDNPQFQSDMLYFLGYSLLLSVAGCLLGLWLAARLLGGEWLFRVLMGNNIWYRLFSGSALPKEKKAKIALILVEVLVATQESSVIYSGWLKNYEIVSGSEGLSYLTLTGANRRDLRAAYITDKSPTVHTESITSWSQDFGPIIQIPGHNLTILGKEIKNINVTYMELKEDPANPGTKIPSPVS